MNERILKLSHLSGYLQFVGVLALSLIIPFFVHLIPSPTDTAIGAYLIPMFFIPVSAVFLFGRWPVSLASASAPFIYSLINGMPTFEAAVILSVELFLFTHILKSIVDSGKLKFLAPLASFLLAKIVVTGLLYVLSFSVYTDPINDYAIITTINAIPGIILLLVIFNFMNRINLPE